MNTKKFNSSVPLEANTNAEEILQKKKAGWN